MTVNYHTWRLGAFAKGSFGEVTAGWARDGSAVAIKRIISPRLELLDAHQETCTVKNPNSVPSGAPDTLTPVRDGELDMSQLSSSLSEIRESYLGTFSRGSSDLPSPESPANTAEHVPSEDEQIVNMALILFLDSVTTHHPMFQGFYSPRLTIKRLVIEIWLLGCKDRRIFEAG
ncbi:hypothetical protein MMC07_004682 [Pseudocyphellaria aurata]|nr:hypothetical protein [Pseudocyphellaria aurata]